MERVLLGKTASAYVTGTDDGDVKSTSEVNNRVRTSAGTGASNAIKETLTVSPTSVTENANLRTQSTTNSSTVIQQAAAKVEIPETATDSESSNGTGIFLTLVAVVAAAALIVSK